MNEESVRFALMTLLQVVENTADSHAVTLEALRRTVPGFQEAYEKESEEAGKRRQASDTIPTSRAAATLGQLNTQIVNVLSRVIAQASK